MRMNNRRTPLKIPGSRFAPVKSKLIFSTGSSGLDAIFGGGIPVGSVVLIEEEENELLSTFFLKYFIGEGWCCHHKLFICSKDCSPSDFLHCIPSVSPESQTTQAPQSTTASNMTIAWRYADAPPVDSRASSTITLAHPLNLKKPVPYEEVINSEIILWPTQEPGTLESLLSSVKGALEKYNLMNEQPENVLRIALHLVGSASWTEPESSLVAFCYKLRMLLSSSSAIAMITLSKELIKEEVTLRRMEDIADYVIHIEPLTNRSNPLFSEYSGLIKFPKMTFVAHTDPEIADWGLKIKRSNLLIEKLHLPPAFAEKGDSEDEDDGRITGGCFSSKPISEQF